MTTKNSSSLNINNNNMQSNKKEYKDDYISAQKAAAEAISISQNTLETTQRQGEQLKHSQNLMLIQSDILHKSNRLLRGMTWSGWVANLFTKDIPPISSTVNVHTVDGNSQNNNRQSSTCFPPFNNNNEANHDDELTEITTSYGLNKSPSSSPLNQIISILKNYKCHVLLLRQCTTHDQYEMCSDICQSLQQLAQQSIQGEYQSQYKSTTAHNTNTSNINNDNNSGRSIQCLRRLEQYYFKIQKLHHDRIHQHPAQNLRNNDIASKFPSVIHNNAIIHSHPTTTSSSSSKNTTPTQNLPLPSLHHKDQYQAQEDHLDILGNNLEELQYMGQSMNVLLQQQNNILDHLDLYSQDLIDQTKMVIRRADRISRRSMWKSDQCEFHATVIIQHLESMKYLAVTSDKGNALVLMDSSQLLHNQTLQQQQQEQYEQRHVFHLFKKRNYETILGFKNEYSQKWLGQTLLGYVACSSTSFGKREEWEFENNDTININDNSSSCSNKTRSTKLLCASAHWGSGGWLVANQEHGTFSLSKCDASGKAEASLWSIIVLDEI